MKIIIKNFSSKKVINLKNVENTLITAYILVIKYYDCCLLTIGVTAVEQID